MTTFSRFAFLHQSISLFSNKRAFDGFHKRLLKIQSNRKFRMKIWELSKFLSQNGAMSFNDTAPQQLR